MLGWFKEVVLALDKLGNALTGGDHRETISARMGRALSRDNSECYLCHVLCMALDKIDPGHCRDAYKGVVQGSGPKRKPK